MIERDVLKRVVSENLQFTLPESMPRNIEIHDTMNKIATLAGIRRSGKTYELYNVIRELLAKGIMRQNIFYMNFEDERLRGITAIELERIIDLFKELSGFDDGSQVYLFFDEIQNIDGWDLWVRRLNERGFKIYITGSSSKLLSREISTHLAGRSLTYLVYPLSFAEFLTSKGVKYGEQELYSKPGEFNRLVTEYMEFGGFPEVVAAETKEDKLRILRSYYDAIIFRDIIDRYKVKDINTLSVTLRYAVGTYSKHFSVSKMHNYFLSVGMKPSKKTINNFVRYAESVFMFSQLYKFSRSFKKSYQSRRKLFLTDTGFVRILTGAQDYGRLLEGLVYVELLRRKERVQSSEIFYIENTKGEVDFVVTEVSKPAELVQVTYDLNSEDEERELMPLLEAMDEFGLKSATIVTFSENERRRKGDRTINIVSFPQWALRENL
jgi:hypothetical protein